MRLLLGSVLALALGAGPLIAGGAGATTNSAADKAASAPRADFSGLVDIGGGRKIYMECRGKGRPTVVLVSGYGGAHDDWTRVFDPGGEVKRSDSAVFPQVGKFTRVCAYDRPGTLRPDGTLSPSTPVRQPTTARDGAADLHALLGASKQKGPYVLVAHSWGGLIARQYASDHPDEVSGLVLVDPASEFLQNTLTPAQWDSFVRLGKQPREPEGIEAVDYGSSARALRAAPPVLGIPSVVLTSDECFELLPGAGVSEERTCQAWREAQDLLAAHLDAEHITRTDSGHAIQAENPQLVTDSIRRVVDAARDGAKRRSKGAEGFGSTTPSATPNATATVSATSSASASAAGAAQYQYTSALPGSGGVSPIALLAVIPAILLVGGGLLTARLIRIS